MTTIDEIEITDDDKKRIRRLGPMAMPAHLEPVAERLFEEACCGSRSMWPLDTKRFEEDASYRAEFYRLVHQGWWNTQELFLARIKGDEEFAPGEEALYRMAMDTIAWTMIQKQLCYARRVFTDKRQPDLRFSNLESVIQAANHAREQSPNCMPLISDLTTFVQVGDLLIYDPDAKRMTIAEVKEGDKNADLSRKVMFYKESGCERFKQFALQDESPKTAKQFERMARQMDRMQFVTEALSDKKTRDPDTAKDVYIKEAVIPVEEWDEEFNAVCDEAMEKGWAINMIDNCLFLGAYSKRLLPVSSTMFWLWMKPFTDDEQTPVARMIDSVAEPLALPLPCMLMEPARIMDLLFGRLHVCMGISIPDLIEECAKQGITARSPKNKDERKTANSWGQSAIRYQGQPIVLEREGKVVVPATGIFVRCLFHFQRPIACINALFEMGDSPEGADELGEAV